MLFMVVREEGLLAGAEPSLDYRPHSFDRGVSGGAERLGCHAVDVGAAHPTVRADLGEKTTLHHPVEKGGGVLLPEVLDESPGHLAEVGNQTKDLHLLGGGLRVLLGHRESPNHLARHTRKGPGPDLAGEKSYFSCSARRERVDHVQATEKGIGSGGSEAMGLSGVLCRSLAGAGAALYGGSEDDAEIEDGTADGSEIVGGTLSGALCP